MATHAGQGSISCMAFKNKWQPMPAKAPYLAGAFLPVSVLAIGVRAGGWAHWAGDRLMKCGNPFVGV